MRSVAWKLTTRSTPWLGLLVTPPECFSPKQESACPLPWSSPRSYLPTAPCLPHPPVYAAPPSQGLEGGAVTPLLKTLQCFPLRSELKTNIFRGPTEKALRSGPLPPSSALLQPHRAPPSPFLTLTFAHALVQAPVPTPPALFQGRLRAYFRGPTILRHCENTLEAWPLLNATRDQRCPMHTAGRQGTDSNTEFLAIHSAAQHKTSAGTRNHHAWGLALETSNTTE